MDELRERFERIADSDGGRGADTVMHAARQKVAGPTAPHPRRRGRMILAGAGALVVALAASGVILFVQRGDDGTSRVATSRHTRDTKDPAAACEPPPARTDAELSAIRTSVEHTIGMPGERYQGIGTGAGQILLMLWPGDERFADRLLARFGNAVRVDVAGRRYCGAIGPSPVCPALTGGEPPPGVHLSLHLERGSIDARQASRHLVEGSLLIGNDGPGELRADRWQGQPIEAALVVPGTRRVVGTLTGPSVGTGQTLNLAPGQTKSIRVVLGPLQRCDGKVGSRVPPGRYGVRAGLGPDRLHPYQAKYFAPEVPLRITR